MPATHSGLHFKIFSKQKSLGVTLSRVFDIQKRPCEFRLFDRIARVCHLFERSGASFWCYSAVSSSIKAEYHAKFAENFFWVITTHPNPLRLRGRQTARLSVWCALSNLAAAICSRAKFSGPQISVQSVEQFSARCDC